MCCHSIMGVHTRNEPPDCCHIHAEDLPDNQALSDNDLQRYDSEGWQSVPDGWTAQHPTR